MKLTAPPPPPPEPPEPPEPGMGGEPGPEKNEVRSETVPGASAQPAAMPEPSEQPQSQPQPEPKPATWPAWFAGFDVALAGVAIVLGFLAASFAARNSDLWLHLGAGRMLTTGEYTPGSDPLSYSAADRAWVNHSWLFDLGSYGLYSLDDNGFALVLAKAIAVAATLLLLIGIRREGQPLWPWALFAVLAVLAAAPQLTFSPLVGSVFFLALTLFLLFRVPNPPGSWRLPIAIGVIFWFWANTDVWFILGPVTIALVLIGEVVQKKSAGESGKSGDTLLPLPDVKTLTRALIVGIVVCMLNPHHVRVWQLPFELAQMFSGATAFAGDPVFAGLLVSPLTAEFWSNSTLGYNLNGLAYAILLLTGVYAVALTGPIGRFIGPPADVEPLPLPHAILWGAVAALSLITAAAIPLLAIVTVPLVASRINILSSRVTLGNWGERKTRMTLAGSAVGRIVTLVLFLLLAGIAWPGWLHPPGWDTPPGWHPSEARRVAWAVEPDPALVETAQQFQQWRDADRLPAEAHGIIASVDLANYCAWYAPKEKVFLNGRYNHHRPEFADFLTLRAGLRLFPQNDPADPKDARDVMARRETEYLAMTASRTDPAEVRERVEQTTISLARQWNWWALWALHGDSAIFGWREEADRPAPLFDRLRLDAVTLAYGSDVPRLPAGHVEPAPPPREWIDDFLRPVEPAPADAYEAIAWIRYKQVLQQRQTEHYQLRALLLRNVPGGVLPLLANLYQAQAVESWQQGNPAYFPPHKGSADEGSLQAIPVLALRAARRAIAANPDHPDGYFALAQALADPDLPIADDGRSMGIITAYQQCLARMPSPDEYRANVVLTSPSEVSMNLANLLLQPLPNGFFRGASCNVPGVRELVGEMVIVDGERARRIPYVSLGQVPSNVQRIGPFVLPLDIAHQVLTRAKQYVDVELAHRDQETRQSVTKFLEGFSKKVQGDLQTAVGNYRTAIERPQTKAKDRYRLARAHGLADEAITILKEFKEGEMAREFGPEAPRVALEMIALELVCGRLADAAADIAQLKEEVAKLDTQSPALQGLPEFLRHLEFQKLVLEGNYSAAGAELESLQGQSVGHEPLVAALLQAKIDPKQYRNSDKVWPAMARLGVAWPTVAMLGAPAIGPSSLGVVGSYWLGRAGLHHFERLAAAREALSEKAQQDAQFFFRRGFLSLIEGDLASAKTRFRQANSVPVPPGWDVGPVRHARAAEYIRQIERAEARAAQP